MTAYQTQTPTISIPIQTPVACPLIVQTPLEAQPTVALNLFFIILASIVVGASLAFFLLFFRRRSNKRDFTSQTETII
jgi:heme/copper-type cytochrome/quinol oxidase subunit 2